MNNHEFYLYQHIHSSKLNHNKAINRVVCVCLNQWSSMNWLTTNTLNLNRHSLGDTAVSLFICTVHHHVSWIFIMSH